MKLDSHYERKQSLKAFENCVKESILQRNEHRIEKIMYHNELHIKYLLIP